MRLALDGTTHSPLPSVCVPAMMDQNDIDSGMDVYDAHGEEVGTVATVDEDRQGDILFVTVSEPAQSLLSTLSTRPSSPRSVTPRRATISPYAVSAAACSASFLERPTPLP